MAGDSTPKANLNADHNESDDAQRCEISDSAVKRAKPAITLRPTASFGAYHDFMQNLVTRMGPRHFAAYEDSVFRHYVQFGPPGVDLPTFEHILSQWDKKSKKFVFTDRNDGEEIPCSFNLEWVMEHTWFSNEGLHVDHNRDRKNRIWSRFFDKPEAGGSSSIAPPKGGPTRRNVEDLLLKLLWYYELTGIKKPALGCTGPAAVDAGRARGPRDLLHKKKRRAEDDDIPIDALAIDEDAEQPNDAVEQMDWPQQVIYWKSIAAMNKALRRQNENKFKGMIAADRVKISALSVKVAKLSAQNRRLREELSEARSGTLSVYKDKSPTGLESEAPPTGRASPQPLFFDIHKESEDAPPEELPPPEASAVDKALEAEINEGEKVSPPAKELLTCTDTLREDTGMEIKQSENARPPAAETSTDDEDAPIVFSKALNKRKRGATGARGKMAADAPPKRKRCKRSVKPSKWVVTPYTEGKKKKEKDNIGDKAIIEVGGEEEAQVQENNAELAPARLQSDPHSIWEKHMSSPMSSAEEMYRDKLNEGIPFPDGFIIKFVGDKDTFVHNYKVRLLKIKDLRCTRNRFTIIKVKALSEMWKGLVTLESLH
ncbi:uncharacterized protein A4U43_C01F10190 [Asparagus officinalis]|uniref:Uncharacterized protein n=1 Tax=Asparagus officinalis TaxID=4686 RepID=A0A5P1FS34_ASPOF|nr:uncharacterized protein A4U43_C01F10190 [Asparagus officinalis]